MPFGINLSSNLNLLAESYSENFSSNFLNVLVYSAGIAFYAIVVWFYYRALAKRDTFTPKIRYPGELGGTFWTNLKVVFDFLLKYIIIFPFISFFWFLVLSAFLLFGSRSQDISLMLLMAMSIVAASRIIAYFNEEIAENVAKIVPLGLLGFFITSPTSFTLSSAIHGFTLLPPYLYLILQYLTYIVALEFILRIVYNLKQFINLDRELKD
jgi:hypothetical protein